MYQRKQDQEEERPVVLLDMNLVIEMIQKVCQSKTQSIRLHPAVSKETISYIITNVEIELTEEIKKLK